MISKEYLKGTIQTYFKKPELWLMILLGVGLGINIYSLVLFSIIVFCGVVICRKTNMDQKETNKDLFDPETPKILNNIIDDAFNEYLIINRAYKDDDVPIKASEEKEIVNIMIDSVSARISDTMMDKLEAYYNKDMVSQIISVKIYMSVMAYVADHNVPKSDDIYTELAKQRNNANSGLETGSTRYL